MQFREHAILAAHIVSCLDLASAGRFPDCRDARGTSGWNVRSGIVRPRAGQCWQGTAAAGISRALLEEALPRVLSPSDGLENLSTQSSQRSQRIGLNYFHAPAGDNTTRSGLRPPPGLARLRSLRRSTREKPRRPSNRLRVRSGPVECSSISFLY